MQRFFFLDCYFITHPSSQGIFSPYIYPCCGGFLHPVKGLFLRHFLERIFQREQGLTYWQCNQILDEKLKNFPKEYPLCMNHIKFWVLHNLMYYFYLTSIILHCADFIVVLPKSCICNLETSWFGGAIFPTQNEGTDSHIELVDDNKKRPFSLSKLLMRKLSGILVGILGEERDVRNRDWISKNFWILFSIFFSLYMNFIKI